MTVANTAEAIEDIVKMFLSYWGTDNCNIPGFPGKLPDKLEEPFAHLVLQHSAGRQGSLAGGNGSRLWDRSGVGVIALYCPHGDLKAAYEKADEIVALFQGRHSPKGVWFRDVFVREVSYISAIRLDISFTFVYELVS
jgi:hypothetical protein